MNKYIITGLLLSFLAAGGLYLYSRQQPIPTPSQTTTSPPQANPDRQGTLGQHIYPQIEVSLIAQNDSNQSGMAILREINGKIQVSITLTNTSSNVAQPAHIHMGFCPKVDEVKYPLTSLVNGKSETTLDVNFEQLKQDLPLAINIHKSESDVSTFVSCGNLFSE